MTNHKDAFIVPFKQRLRQALIIKKMSQQNLADATGLSKSTISNYVNGLRLPNRDIIAQLSELLEVSPGWLMGINGIEIDDTIETLKEKQEQIQKLKNEKIELIAKNLQCLNIEELNLLMRVLDAIFPGRMFNNDS